MRRSTWTFPLAAAVVVTLAGCTAAAPDRTPATTETTIVRTVTPTPSASTASPIAAGPTTTADGACPFLSMEAALTDLGERLGRATVSTSGGKPVGCTFYPATGPLASSEHLPPPTVPVIAIAVSRYADADAAHNAMVLSTKADPDAYSNPTTGVDEGISFSTDFVPEDGGADSAYTFRKGTAVVLVQIAQTKATLTAQLIGADVAKSLT